MLNHRQGTRGWPCNRSQPDPGVFTLEEGGACPLPKRQRKQLGLDADKPEENHEPKSPKSHGTGRKDTEDDGRNGQAQENTHALQQERRAKSAASHGRHGPPQGFSNRKPVAQADLGLLESQVYAQWRARAHTGCLLEPASVTLRGKGMRKETT